MNGKWSYTASANHYAALLRRIVVAFLAGMGLAGGEGRDAQALAITIPRRIHRTIRRTLVLAESALRRIILMAAADRLLALRSAPQPAWQFPALSPSPLWGGVRGGVQDNNSITPTPAPIAFHAISAHPPHKGEGGVPAFNLFDPLKRLEPYEPFPESGVAIADAAHLNAPVDARGLGVRLLSLLNALDNLPAERDRLIRWFARRHKATCKPKRFWPLKGGFAPGCRPNLRRKDRKDVDDILDDTARLANTLRRELDTS